MWPWLESVHHVPVASVAVVADKTWLTLSHILLIDIFSLLGGVCLRFCRNKAKLVVAYMLSTLKLLERSHPTGPAIATAGLWSQSDCLSIKLSFSPVCIAETLHWTPDTDHSTFVEWQALKWTPETSVRLLLWNVHYQLTGARVKVIAGSHFIYQYWQTSRSVKVILKLLPFFIVYYFFYMQQFYSDLLVLLFLF